MKKIFFGFFFMVLWMPVSLIFANEYHVSMSGDDLSGKGTLERPWRHPEYASRQLKGNDTLYIHAGVYLIEPENIKEDLSRVTPMISPPANLNNDAQSPILITNYENDIVFLDGTTTPPYPVIGSGMHTNHVTIDGFIIRGAATFMWVDNCTIKNCDIFGGIDCPTANGGDNFGCVLRVEGVTDCRIQNNKIHDNQIGITQKNSPLIMEYDSTNLIIENNDIYNSVATGIRLKDNPEDVIIRYNFIHHNTYSGLSGGNQDSGHNVSVYQNVFKDNNRKRDISHGAITTEIHILGWQIYNNTFINNMNADIRSIGTTQAGDIQVWNNIMYRESGFYYYLGWSSSGSTFSDQWSFSDYNNFYSPANNAQWREWTTTWNNLAEFAIGNGQGFDEKSSAASPQFVNVGGSNPEDYRLSPTSACLYNGRSGSYAPVQGAYIKGTETIGCKNCFCCNK